jgi:hypothetical protein
MVARRPVVVISGQRTELPPGDSIVGGSVGTLTAGSGLDGGGDLSSTTETNVSLAPNPSGLIFVDNKYLATDGVAQRTGETALASGNYALAAGTAALASGIAGSSLAATALASGNAALADITAIPGGTIETFTAASAVAPGYAVGLDDTGSVQAVAANIISVEPPSASSGDAAITAASNYGGISYDPDQDCFVCVYQDGGNSNYGTARVATLDAGLTSVTYGTAVVFYSGSLSSTDFSYVGNSKHCVVYRANSNSGNGYANLIQVTGTSLSVGTTNIFYNGGTAILPYVTYDSRNNFALVTYAPDGNSYYPTLRVLEISGTSLSGGPNYTIASESASTSGAQPCYDGVVEDRCAFVWYSNSGGNSCRSKVGNITGSSSVTFGSQQTLVTGAIQSRFRAIFDPDSAKLIFVGSDASAVEAYAVTATIGNTTLTIGTVNNFASKRYDTIQLTSYTSTSKVIGILENYTDSSSDVQTFEVSGTSISANTAGELWPYSNSDMHGLAYSSTDDRAAAFIESSNDNYPYTIVLDNGPSTAYIPTVSSQNNFIGIAQTTAASGSAVQVRLPGSYDQNNTGLTPGAVYYVNPTTSGFTTTATQPSSWSGAVNWGPIGRAVNSTTLLLTDMI